MRRHDRPSVAVCIPTYNQAAYLPIAVESALAQRYDGPLEVWIGDDASTDGTPGVAAGLAERDDRVRYVRNDANLGIAGNTSALMAQPETDLVVRLDSDDVLEPEYVERVAAALARHDAAGWAHTAIVEIDERGARRRTRRIARPSGFQEAEDALRASLRGYRTAANVVTFRSEALRRLRYYEGRPEFVEDYDLAVRMADAGFGNVYLDEPLARYRVWSDSGGMRSRRKALQLAGYRRIFDEAIGPAWARRGWSLREVERRRRRLAAENCASCFAPQYTAAEREELLRLLRELGDGPELRARIAVCRAGGAGALRRLDALPYRARGAAKAVLRRARRRP